MKFVHTPATIRAMDWGVFPKDDHDQADWKIADAAIAQMKSLPADKPFFLAVGFRLPHVPCFASQQWFDLFPPEDADHPAAGEGRTTATTCPSSRGICTGRCPSRGCRG